MHPNVHLHTLLVMLAISLPFIGLTLWSLIDLVRLQTKAIYGKFFWLAIVILIPYLGGLAYLLIGRKLLHRRK